MNKTTCRLSLSHSCSLKLWAVLKSYLFLALQKYILKLNEENRNVSLVSALRFNNN